MWLALTMVPRPAELWDPLVGACGHCRWTFDVPGRGLSVGTQDQVACQSPVVVVRPKLFDPVYPNPGRKELVLEAWDPCLCCQDVMMGRGARGGSESSHFQLVLRASGGVLESRPAPKPR